MSVGKHNPETSSVHEHTSTPSRSTRSGRNLWGPIIVWIAIFATSNLGCDQEHQNGVQPTGRKPKQTLQSFTTSHAEAGIRKWTLIGNEATFLKDRVEVQQPKVQVFQDGKLAITLTGERGEILQRSNNVKLFDNVVGVSSDGKLYTSELHWRAWDERLYAPHKSRIARGNSTLLGTELEASPSLDKILIKHAQFNLYAKDEKMNELHQ